MSSSDNQVRGPSPANEAPAATSTSDRRLLLAYLGPLVLFMLFTQFEPKPAAVTTAELPAAAAPQVAATSEMRNYPLIYTIKLAAVCLLVAACWPAYRLLPGPVSVWGVMTGVVGVGLWIGLCQWGLEARILPPLGLGWVVDSGARSAYNPLEELKANPALAAAFLGVRFFGLAVVIPFIEEVFLRGFLMRYVADANWTRVPFGVVSRGALAAGTLVPMLMHPAELIAALVWFSLVTVLMVRTRSFWDCVVAHAVTNLLLGAYVVQFGQWELW
jgi:uncharacterized protein